MGYMCAGPIPFRVVLSGTPTVIRTDRSWRAMPRGYGKWERADKRHQLWCASGLRPRILAALGREHSEPDGQLSL